MTQFKKLWLTLVVSIALIAPISAQATFYVSALYRQQSNGKFMRVGYVIVRVLDFEQTGDDPAITLYFVNDDSHNVIFENYSDLVPCDSTKAWLKTDRTTTSTSPSSSASSSSYNSQGNSLSPHSSGSLKRSFLDRKPSKKKAQNCKAEYHSIIHWGGENHQLAITFTTQKNKPIHRDRAKRVRLKVKKGVASTYIDHDPNAFFIAAIYHMTTASSSRGSATGRQSLSERIERWRNASSNFPNPDPMFGVYCDINVVVAQHGENPNISFIFYPPGQDAPLTIMQPIPITDLHIHLLSTFDDPDMLTAFTIQQQTLEPNPPESPGDEEPPQFEMDDLHTATTGPLDQATDTSDPLQANDNDYEQVIPPAQLNGPTEAQNEAIASNPGNPVYGLNSAAMKRLFPQPESAPQVPVPAPNPGGLSHTPGHEQIPPTTPGLLDQATGTSDPIQANDNDYEPVILPAQLNGLTETQIKAIAGDTAHTHNQVAMELLFPKPALAPPVPPPNPGGRSHIPPRLRQSPHSNPPISPITPDQLDQATGTSPPRTTPGQLDQATGTSPPRTTHSHEDVEVIIPIEEYTPEEYTPEELHDISRDPHHPGHQEAFKYSILPPRSSSSSTPRVLTSSVRDQSRRYRRHQTSYDDVPVPQNIFEFPRREISEISQMPSHQYYRDAKDYLLLAPGPILPTDPLFTPDFTPIVGIVGDRGMRTNAELRWLILTNSGEESASAVISTRNRNYTQMTDDALQRIIRNQYNSEWEKQCAKEEIRRRRQKALLRTRTNYEEYRSPKRDGGNGPDPQGGAGISGLSGGVGGITLYSTSSKSNDSSSDSNSGQSGYGSSKHAFSRNNSLLENPQKEKTPEQLNNHIVPHYLLPTLSQSVH